MEQHAQTKHEIRQKDRTWFSHFFITSDQETGWSYSLMLRVHVYLLYGDYIRPEMTLHTGHYT